MTPGEEEEAATALKEVNETFDFSDWLKHKERSEIRFFSAGYVGGNEYSRAWGTFDYYDDLSSQAIKGFEIVM